MGHRGFSAVSPENTVAAFDLAVKAGADGFELDVHMTKDGQFVVIHDETVDRTTDGTGWVKDLTLVQIKELDAGSWFSPKFKNERVPTLGEVFDVVKESDHCINIELKNNLVAYPKMEELMIKEIERHGMAKRVILSSFNHVCLYHLHLYRPSFQLGVLCETPISEPWSYVKSLGASAIHPLHIFAAEDVVTKCHEYGVYVRPFTVDEEEEARRLIALEVDAIITNVPDRLKNAGSSPPLLI